MKTVRICAVMVALAGVARAETKPLAERNALTKSLAARVKLGPGELDVAEVVAVRDAVRAPSPMAVAYAASLEQALSQKQVTEARGKRALLELALDLASFAGPDADAYRDLFKPALDLVEGVKLVRPRPELEGQLADVGAWATEKATELASTLPAADAARARARLAMDRGRFGEVAALAQSALHGAKKNVDPVWQGLYAAALTLQGKDKDAAPYVAAATASGGEADRLVKQARVRRVRQLALEHATDALLAAKVPIGSKLPRGHHVELACEKLFSSEMAPSRAASEAAVACATLLWEQPGRDWLPKAAALAPSGTEGAALRAAAQLSKLLPDASGKRADAGALPAVLDSYLGEVRDVTVEESEDRRVLALLGWIGAAANPMKWVPATADEKALLEPLGACDPSAFALRAIAARPDRARLGELVEHTIDKCATAPGGLGTTVNAIELYLQLHYEHPQMAKSDLEPLILKLAHAHEDDPAAVGAHADAVALKALSHGSNRIALEAALARYEQAIAHWLPAAGGALRARLESNAAFLSMAVGRAIGDANPDARSQFYLRAAGHLRMALALGETPAMAANRAQFDIDAQMGTTVTTLDLEKMPAGRARNRAACVMADQASRRGDAVVMKRLLALATAKPASEEHQLTVPELLVDTNASLSVLLEEARLRPFVDLRTSIWLAPPCEPEKVKLPKLPVKPVAQKPATTAPSTNAPAKPAAPAPQK